MVKKFKGAYQSVEEATAQVEHLITEGYQPEDVTVVTHKENKGTIESLTIAEVDPVLNKQNKAIWDRVRDTFSESEVENPLKKYKLDIGITERYNKTIKHGGYVIITEETEANQTSYNSNNKPIKNKNNPILSTIGEVSESVKGKIPTKSSEAPSIEGIPLKESDGTFGGNHPIDNPSMPRAPGTDLQRDI
ncbi:general stress protein [Carnobacterium pleistocenium]|uniref:general stress protein n=1 Tax=Carnobacterium pleistocenium TaxID=181073 RepID=UPI000691CBF2|nr:general stress protein [Carnobacterium pleistocenium]